MSTLHEGRCIFLISRSLLRMRCFGKSCVENWNTRFVPQLFRKLCRLRDNVEKYCRVGQATDVNMAHAHCIPKATNTHTHTLTQYNTYWFFNRNNGLRTRRHVTLYVHCPVDVILPSTCRSSKWFLPLRFPHGNSMCISALPHACHMLYPFVLWLREWYLARSADSEACHCGVCPVTFYPVRLRRKCRSGHSSVHHSTLSSLIFCWPCIVVCQYNEANVMHFSLNLLRIKDLCMFQTLFTHSQDALHKLHLVF
jgi:hypothetical protein